MELESMESLLTTQNIAYAVFAVIAVIVAFILIKKVAGCIIRTVIFAIMLAVLAYIYVNFINNNNQEEVPAAVEVRE